MLKYLVSVKVLVATALVFFFVWALSKIPLPATIDPISEALADFKTTDIVFSKLTDYDNRVDTNIVVVNIGQLRRDEVMAQVNNLQRFKPKVIGIDALFRELEVNRLMRGATRADSLAAQARDSAVAATFQRYDNIVLVSELSGYDAKTATFDTVLTSHPYYNRYVKTGFANIVNDDYSKRTIRGVSPIQTVAGRYEEPSFSVAIMRLYNPAVAERCLKRGNRIETINWQGNIRNFFFLEQEVAADPTEDLSFIQGKIVLMAYVKADERRRDLEDLYFTPMNEQYAGKTFPDLYGIYVHANFLSMMLKDAYIDTMPTWLSVVLALVLTHLVLAGLTWLHYRLPNWFDIVVPILQIAFTFLLLYVVVWIFDRSRYQVDFTLLTVGVVLGPIILEIFLPFYDKTFTGGRLQLVRPLRKSST
ncbi:MAG: CHASE2 domain-containing protein [Bacteroidia bacterium]|nr:CHASE2 domain-containing protein [Bacteroidia bacterium]